MSNPAKNKLKHVETYQCRQIKNKQKKTSTSSSICWNHVNCYSERCLDLISLSQFAFTTEEFLTLVICFGRHSTNYLPLLVISWSSVDHDRDLTIQQRRRRVLWNFFAVIPRLELKRGDCVRVQRERAKFIAMPFLFSSQLKIWSFHFVVVQRRQRNLQKSAMQVQSCCFAHISYCVLDVPTAVAVVIL